MADFARLGLAAGIPGFAEAYETNLEEGCQAAVEASPLAAGILSLLDAHNGYWQGSTTELIRRLQELDPTSREFQKLSARAVGKKLASSLKGDLAAVGVEVDQGKGNKGQRFLILSRVVESQHTQTPTPVQNPVQNNGATAVPSVPTTSSSTSAPEIKETPAVQKAPTPEPVNGKSHETRITPPPSNNSSNGNGRALSPRYGNSAPSTDSTPITNQRVE